MSEGIQNQQGRQGKVVIALIAVAVLAICYIAYSYAMSGKAEQGSHVSNMNNNRATDSKESEHYSEVLNQYNTQKSAKAEQEKATYLSVLSTNSSDIKQQQPQLPPPPPPVEVQYSQQPQQQYAQQQTVQEETSNPNLLKQVEGIVSTWVAKPHAEARIGKVVDYVNTLENSGEYKVKNLNASQTPVQKVIEDFALVPAILNTDLDTDENSVVIAIVPTGKYKGAILYAMGYRRITNTIDMTFTAMQFKGRSYKINAKPVDQHTNRTTLSGDVNNRYFTRIVIPALATGLGKAGQLYSQAASQNIITSNGAIVQTYPSTPDGKAVSGTIAGGMAEQAGRVLANDASQMPIKQVELRKGTTIGIQFLGPVLSSDDMAENIGNLETSSLGRPASDANTRYPMPESNNQRQYPMTQPYPYQMGAQ